MKGNNMKKKIVAVLLAVAALSGCDLENESSDSSQSVPADTQSSSVISSVSTQSSSESPAQTDSSVDKPSTLVDKEREQIYVDYNYIESPETISECGEFDEISKRALAAVVENDEYKYFVKNYGSSENAEINGYWLSDDGTPTPSVDRIYNDDFDCDGTKESFALVSFPVFDDKEWKNASYTVYVGETAEIVGKMPTVRGAAMLDYGFCKQLVINGYSGMDKNSCSQIVGVIDGKPKPLYSLGAKVYKLDCFVTTFGMNGTGDFMIYDNVNGEYLAIMGEELTAEEIYEMDKTDSLADRRGNIKYAVCLCEKYYMILKNNQDTGQAFTYENGRFTRDDTKGLRISLGTTGRTIQNVNYDAAVSAMITPEQARKLA